MRDQVTILVAAGRGGDGMVSFRREKYIPRGGPDGGDGGRGGSIVVIADDKTQDFDSIRNRGSYKAETGSAGARSRKYGHAGADLFIKVPAGTVVYDDDTGELLAELAVPGDNVIVANGGTGGRGNCHFATPQNRVPQEWEPGTEGEERSIKLVFSIPADVAVVGLPNAGKSSLMSALTNSKTKIAEYPFTTRSPKIGVCNAGFASKFSILDMPALVEGSAEGRGIGNSFLNHLNRVKLIVYLIDGTLPEGLTGEQQFKALKNEVAAYDSEFINKKELVIINKKDVLAEGAEKTKIKGVKGPILKVSATEKDGLEKLIAKLTSLLELEVE